MTESEADAAQGGGSLRGRIRSRIREARQAKGLTQAELGRLVGVSRFVVNRIEAGATDLTPPVAAQLEKALDLPDLRALVANRDRSVVAADPSRDTVVARLLGQRGLRRLRIVLADGLDLRSMLATRRDDDSVLVARDVEVVVPTARRERELFGDQDSMHGHIEYQLKRLSDLKKSYHYAANSLRLHESDRVTASVVIAETRDGVESAVWAPMAGLTEAEGEAMPVGVSADRHVVATLDAHVDTLVTGSQLLSNEALCHVDPGPGRATPVFTRYITLGEDQEEDVGDREGIATALVLVVALCPRASHGVARRVITYLRLHSRLDRQPSLFSNTVTDVDVQRARALEDETDVSGRRSTRSALASALDTNAYLESLGGVLPDLAYRLAAAREMAMFDLDLPAERFTPVEVPEDLWLIRKKPVAGRRRAALAPRLLLLELESHSENPELALLQGKADVEFHGVRDYLEDLDLNDFLVQARDAGWLGQLFARLGIAER